MVWTYAAKEGLEITVKPQEYVVRGEGGVERAKKSASMYGRIPGVQNT